MMKRILASIALAFGLAACANLPGGGAAVTPAQTVFTVKTGYATALTAAVAYKRLPACSETVKAPCSDAKVVAQLQKADLAASTALDSAETVVRTPGFGKDIINSALMAANSALAAFVAVTAQLGK